MAITHNLTREVDTSGQIIWGPSGASGVTKNMDLNNLGSGNYREGVYADLGANWEGEYGIDLRMETGSAPAAGGLYVLWLHCSHDSSVWPLRVTGADATITGSASLAQSYGFFDHFVAVTNDANQACRQNLKRWKPSGRYVTPVICNWSSTATRNNGTSNLSRIILTKLRGVVSS